MTDEMNNTQAALDFARRTTEPTILAVNFDGAEEQILVTTGEDGTAHVETIRSLFSDRAAAPQRRKGTIVVHDLGSFIAATNRDSDDGSVIFANVGDRKVTAILDFHEARNPGPAAPRWGQDRIEYGFTLSPQLTAWLRASGAPMDQRAFARLIDDRIGDVGGAPPDPSLAADFAKRRGITFASVTDLLVFTRMIAAKSTVDSTDVYDDSTGGSSIQYKKRNDVTMPDGSPVAVPAAFVLAIPILCGLGATVFNVAVRLRYDIDDKRIAWRVELNAMEQYVLAAIEEALVVVRKTAPDGCGLPVFMGVAPAP
jgi:hypothetical protein